ncbi:receptor expression-enhancing protein [Anaeramoeba flamelloides]|uniref:Receptor expression-enhancing protein n=1 Tax=Anaeramoeba flamelloides TaxID=1746091 RepID=A0AAV7YUR3_9EUKA|nr:receptor expression-enhancing protein [Anaeramoeba flamelloides]KAJ6228497.1 receptor expression-enhancing protein [Anaeramoeba flamelloides]
MVFGKTLTGIVQGIVGFLWPAYKSFKAIKTEEKDDDTELLIYWTVAGFFSFFEYWADFIVSWFPFYYELKIVFFIWLQNPYFNGSQFLWKYFLMPFLDSKEKQIDEGISGMVSKGKVAIEKGSEYGKVALDEAKTLKKRIQKDD